MSGRLIAAGPTSSTNLREFAFAVSSRIACAPLKPNALGVLSIQTAQHDALLLPTAAVRHDGDKTFVYVVGKSGRERRSVAIGSKESGMVEIKKGVGTDDEVLLPAMGSS